MYVPNSHLFALLLILIASLPHASPYEWMSALKIPSFNMENAKNKMEVKKQFGDKKLVVITGTSSGMGRRAAKALLRTGEYHVIGAVRDLDKMDVVADLDEFDRSSFTPMHLDLNSFSSVHSFVEELFEFKKTKPVDRLVCNAGIYQPSLQYAKWSEDGHEQTMQTNFLSHFLLISKLVVDMSESDDPRVITVGSVTGNDNTVGGGGVYPVADLKDLDGLKAGFSNPISMLDGYNFIGAKAYKDSKLVLMMTANMLHDRYHKATGISFSSIYPGCIAESPLFREKRPWFRKYFPVFMKFVTGGFVGEEEAGQRLFQVCHDPRCVKSGVYWSWNGGPREGRGAEAIEKGGQIIGAGGAGGGWNSIYENEQSDKVKDVDTTYNLFKYATKVTGAEWPEVNVAKSPCPTLKVVGLVTAAINAKEEAKRMKPEPGMVGAIDLRAKAANNFDFITQSTVVKAVKAVQDKFLGDLPEEAVNGSYQSERSVDDAVGHAPENVSVSPSSEEMERMKRRLDDLIEKGELNCTDNPELCEL
mmetsp:Transcript_6467/g.12938  ORF Transcript_6467/g.12938 Transcript_6467/m.12938 type:complete len:531 (-) Transcript_6467:147-1739(-)|eukprot:CAMPEP_0118644366 /NCGR_PEP_ID=MMETSP0785-20121206/6907_1 /TAXON_ID=91992 /ORGANISM="Bolidomonas pacifica, Strain CCMP 1866" /LENGTH=530 /DNA_ID=CAMNT_0006536133 /DNA_START=267 /DNA_END=1859 /DNA_ORIENTATION=-